MCCFTNRCNAKYTGWSNNYHIPIVESPPCGVHYITICICQKTKNCTLKIVTLTVCQLYLNKTDL